MGDASASAALFIWVLAALAIALVAIRLFLWPRIAIGYSSRVTPELRQFGETRSSTLVVTAPPIASASYMKDTAALMQVAAGGADLLMLHYGPPITGSNWVMPGSPLQMAAAMEKAIAEHVEKGGYEKVILTGYSAGALLIRKALLFGVHGYGSDHPAGDSRKTPTSSWTNRLDRIVLLAGMNGGWSRERSSFGGIPGRIWIPICQLLGIGHFVLAIERGHPFVENLRIEWLRFQKDERYPRIIVQLVGAHDSVVDADSDMDLSAAANFRYITLPHMDHVNLANVGAPIEGMPPALRRDPDLSKAAHAVAFAMDATMAHDQDKLQATTPSLYSLADLDWVATNIGRVVPRASNDRIEHVVLVLHGIRDNGHWAQRYRLEIEGSLDVEKVSVQSPSFGRFPLTDFMLGRRDRPVRWFARTYSEIRAQFPNVRTIGFIGHSYGTWVFAKALERFSAITIDNAFLAASVLPRDYRWNRYIGEQDPEKRQLMALADAPANNDKVVAIFPASYHVIARALPFVNKWRPTRYLFSLGDAGVNGFDDPVTTPNRIKYLIGGHGAFKDELSYMKIASIFAIEGPSDRYRQAQAGLAPLAKGPSLLTRFVNSISVVILLVVLGLLAVVVFAATLIPGPNQDAWRLLAIIAAAAAVYILLSAF